MTYEFVDQRILGALQLIDVTTGQHVRQPMLILAQGGMLVRNSRGFYAIVAAEGLGNYALAFDLPVDPEHPEEPAIESIPLTVTIRDPQHQYLPRIRTINLPRDPDPANFAASNSVFQPVPVRLFPAPIAPLMANWGVLRATVRAQGNEARLGGALILVQQNGTIIGRGLTDPRGEALVAISGIPLTTWEEGAVITSEIAVTLLTVVDPSATGLPDPDDLETRRDTLPHTDQSLAIAAGRYERVSIAIALP